MKKFFSLVLVWAIGVLPCVSLAGDGSGTKEDHQQLRTLMSSLRDAVNTQDFDGLKPHLHSPFAATMITQDVVTTPEDLKAYFEKWMTGDKAFIKKMKITPEADELTAIYDGKFGVVYGSNKEEYELATGNNYSIDSRWTATVIKDQGQWKLLAIHSGVNFVDNPVLHAVADETTRFGIGGVILGFALGLAAFWGYRKLRS